MKRNTGKERLCVLLLAAALFLTACGQSATAAVMQLIKTEGTVSVRDDAEKDVSIIENMKLYSGYQVGTVSQSYAWINLDSVKLVKMDEDSDVELQKNGKELEIHVNSGSLFFNVTEPLAEDETMNIRSSTMIVGIRGTCGWVSVLDEGHMQVYILEGTVQCEVTDPVSGLSETASVSAGEMADLFYDPNAPEDERCQIAVKKFSRPDIPNFVLDEVDPDELGTELAETSPDTSETETAETSSDELLEPVLELSEYEGFGRAYNGVMPAKKDGMWGAINYQNDTVVPFTYTDFQAPDEQGNFVLVGAASEGQNNTLMGERHYTLFNSQGNVLYDGEYPVRATDGMYILLKEAAAEQDQCIIEYYQPDGTLVQSLTTDRYSGRINGFYDGISLVYHGSSKDRPWLSNIPPIGNSYDPESYQIGEVDQSGSITWHEDPVYIRSQSIRGESLPEAAETTPDDNIHYDGGQGGYGIYILSVPLNSANHGYYPVAHTEGEAGWIALCSDNYEILGDCDLYELQPDAEQGFVPSESYYDGEGSNSFRGFYHDGTFLYNYGSNMVWTVGDRNVLVDFSLYPGMTSDTVDNRIVKAVYDQILMSDADYWLVQKGEQWGYIDHDGNEAALFDDASEFYQQYALVIEDGTAYLINEDFEKLQDLGAADSVNLYGELLATIRGDTRYFYRINR